MRFWERIKAFLVSGGGILCVFLSLTFLFVLVSQVLIGGLSVLNWKFLSSYPSRFPEEAGVLSAIAGTFWLMSLTALIAIPLGIMTGVFLEEYLQRGFWAKILRINVYNLAGVPSILYGVLGLGIFVRAMGLGRSVLAGALTASFMILPVIIVATAEAIRAVPNSLRHAAFAVGATKRQVIWGHVLPSASPGIITGVILALARAMGEAAPLILVGALTFVAFVPKSVMDSFTVLSIQIFNWADRPQVAFHALAAGGIILLLLITLGMNAIAIYFRTKAVKPRRIR